MTHGAQSETAEIRRLILRPPYATSGADWQALGWTAAPNMDAAAAEFDAFAALVGADGVEVHILEGDGEGLDSIYVHDPLLVTGRGAILCNMGKRPRAGEPAAFRPLLDRLGVPVLGEIGGAGRLEGGDVVWLDDRTLAVGQGYRTNADGIAQLRDLLGDAVDDIVTVPLPHWRGPNEVLHLMSILSPVDDDLAVVYAPLLPVFFRDWLVARGIRLVEIPEDEFASMGANVLATAPRRCVVLAGNPKTRALLQAAGCEVREYEGREISLKGAGGPTCLTRPILRG